MNNSDKKILFREIINHLNKKFCESKIKIIFIHFFKKGDLHKSFPDNSGFYFKDMKEIKIKDDEPFISQIMILVHEFTHAYQHQILKKKGRIIHDKKSGDINSMFLNELDAFLKISIRD